MIMFIKKGEAFFCDFESLNFEMCKREIESTTLECVRTTRTEPGNREIQRSIFGFFGPTSFGLLPVYASHIVRAIKVDFLLKESYHLINNRSV